MKVLEYEQNTEYVRAKTVSINQTYAAQQMVKRSFGNKLQTNASRTL